MQINRLVNCIFVKKMSFFFLVILLYNFALFSETPISMYYLGVLPGGSGEFGNELSGKLRDRLSCVNSINLASEDDVGRLIKFTDFNLSANINKAMVNYLRDNADEKSLVVFGAIDNYSIRPEREKLLLSKIVGLIDFKLYVYSLYFGSYEYVGTLSAKSEIFKGIILFSDSREISMSAIEREKIKKKLINELLDKLEDMIVGIVGGVLVKSGLSVPDNVKAESVPSVSDMFNIPSVSVPETNDAKK